MSENNNAAFLWSIANLLRGTYKQADYGKVILPFTILRRLDAALEGTKDKVLAVCKDKSAVGAALEFQLNKASGYTFYNKSPYDLKKASGVLKPISAVGGGSAHDPVMTTLREAVDQMNAIFDDPDLTSGDGEGIVAYVSAKAREDVNIQKQAKANTLEQFLDSPDLMTVMLGALFASQGNFTSMTKELAEDDEKLAKFVKAIGKVVHAQLAKDESENL